MQGLPFSTIFVDSVALPALLSPAHGLREQAEAP
jgi:hypothetical protein